MGVVWMTKNKRFTITPISLIDETYKIIDKDQEYTFPPLGDTLNYMFCKALNELYEEIGTLSKKNTALEVRLKEKDKLLKKQLSVNENLMKVMEGFYD